MTEKHDKWVCKSCGHVREMDSGRAEAKAPSPEVNMSSILPPPVEVEPAVKSDTPDTEYVDVGLGFALGDCDECGGHSWQRISLGSLEKDDPKIERREGSEDLPSEKGFQEIIPPSPEISQNTVMMQDTYTEPPEDVKRHMRESSEPVEPGASGSMGTTPMSDEESDPNMKFPFHSDVSGVDIERRPRETVEPGVSGSMGTTPLGGEESNPNMMLPFGADIPVADAKSDDAPKKDKYVCEECGGILEVEMDQVELPKCVHCGSGGWLKESF